MLPLLDRKALAAEAVLPRSSFVLQRFVTPVVAVYGPGQCREGRAVTVADSDTGTVLHRDTEGFICKPLICPRT